MTALQELLAKVEAGSKQWTANELWEALKCHKQKQFNAAFHGSLDAAKALHEAVLHGWDVSMGTGHAGTFEAGVATGSRIEIFNGTSGVMSRAWLIAIIKALIAHEDAK